MFSSGFVEHPGRFFVVYGIEILGLRRWWFREGSERLFIQRDSQALGERQNAGWGNQGLVITLATRVIL
jgi:hypothetical protein